MAPSQDRIREIFAPLAIQGEQQKTVEHIDENVDWTILGNSPMSRKYSGRKDFVDNTLVVLRERVLSEPLRIKVKTVTGGGEGNDWCTVEMGSVDAKCKNGMPYDMVYCWIIRWKEEMMVEVRAYLDTELLTRVMDANQ